MEVGAELKVSVLGPFALLEQAESPIPEE